MLDALEAGQRVELGLEGGKRERGLGLPKSVELVGEPVGSFTAGREALADHPQAPGNVLERIPGHGRILPADRRSEAPGREGPPAYR